MAKLGENPFYDLLLSANPNNNIKVISNPRYVSPSVDEIVSWRHNLSERYATQLEAPLTWNENSDFTQGFETSTSDDMLMHYVAAVLDQRGEKVASNLAGSARPPRELLDEVFGEVERRSFGSRFPQLLLGVLYWLPYDRHLIIQEADWSGQVCRYGSLIRLADEITQVRNFIANASPAATVEPSQRKTIDGDILSVAWDVISPLNQLCKVAIEKNLPLWTSG